MRVIKKQDQNEAVLQKINYGGEIPATRRHPVPAWMEAAAVQPKVQSAPESVDLPRIERAAYERGFQEAEQTALEAAEKKVESIMERYADAIAEIGSCRRNLYSQVEREVVKLALEVAKKIVHREVHVDPEIVQTLIRVALSHVTAKSAVTVRVNPADYNFVRERHAGSTKSGSADRELVLVADSSVDRGGCLIETECGDIDARIQAEFREVEYAFFGSGN